VPNKKRPLPITDNDIKGDDIKGGRNRYSRLPPLSVPVTFELPHWRMATPVRIQPPATNRRQYEDRRNERYRIAKNDFQ
jgi:hypothetical protein